MNKIVLFYVPIPNEDTGRTIAKELLEKKLIACANIFPAHTAIYRWDGKINQEKEQVTIFKTCLDKKDQVMTEIKRLHPYDCPCVLVIEPDDCNREFLDWVNEQTRNS